MISTPSHRISDLDGRAGGPGRDPPPAPVPSPGQGQIPEPAIAISTPTAEQALIRLFP